MLVARLRAIPDGQIASVAERAGMDATAIRRLRRGQATDIRLSTLERLARGLQESAEALIADPDPAETPEPTSERGVDPQLVRRLVRKTRAFAADVERLLVDVPELATPARRDRAGHGASGKT